MNTYSQKLKLLFKPFALILVSFLIIYSLLNWGLIIKAGLAVNEDLIKLWLPFGLAAIPVFIWLYPKLNRVQYKRENGAFNLSLLATLLIGLPTTIAQHYLTSATGKLTSLKSPNEIITKEKTKYYQLDQYYIDKSHPGIQTTATVSGKYNNDLNYRIYVVLPVYSSAEDTAKGNPLLWLGTFYSKKISNNSSEEEKKKAYDQFANESQELFDKDSFNKYTYFERLGQVDEHDEYITALKTIEVKDPSSQIILSGKSDSFETRTNTSFPWIFGSTGISFAIILIIIAFLKIRETAPNTTETEETKSEWKELLQLFIPSKGFAATPILIDVNVLFFLAMVVAGLGFINFSAIDLYHWGGNLKEATLKGDWWRLISNIFLHGGIIHLLANMVGLFFIGLILEPVMGSGKFLLVYTVAGICASLTSVWWHENTVSVGASGAIFGMYGFFLATLLLKVFPPDFGKAFLASTLVFIGYNLAMGLTGGIDNAAHVGGLLSGFIIGFLLSHQIKKKLEQQEV
ncbi:MAG: rhomboid family intramembrane serine protease [Chitinophagaceae bacterium]|uniref:rhomboid family intramembrane serine protease n=1 Tax=unclassified Paraflavitalea TaxID=2798305 RepID=UPI003D325157|nr:rhomboid family intramembrane serine protease [Chitinophagaceae bacterium]